jgi:hypothetical protein
MDRLLGNRLARQQPQEHGQHREGNLRLSDQQQSGGDQAQRCDLARDPLHPVGLPGQFQQRQLVEGRLKMLT